MILMPKQKVNSFTIKRIQHGKATVKESAKVHLDLVKAEPENEERRKALLDFSQALLDVMKEEDSKRSVFISCLISRIYELQRQRRRQKLLGRLFCMARHAGDVRNGAEVNA
jgi:hypothetical protein